MGTECYRKNSAAFHIVYQSFNSPKRQNQINTNVISRLLLRGATRRSNLINKRDCHAPWVRNDKLFNAFVLAVGGGPNCYFYRGPSHRCHERKDA
jgi:hypothetical protein